MKEKVYIIQVKVHPAVARHFDNTFLKDKITGAYNIRQSDFYYCISGALQQSHLKSQSLISKKYSNFIPISLIINEFDFYHFGYMISEYNQYRISRFFFNMIIDKACYKIMLAHCICGIPRDTALKAFLDENFFEEDELNYSNLRKIYQRKYLEKESEIREFLQVVSPENGTNLTQVQHIHNTKKNVRNVPFLKLT